MRVGRSRRLDRTNAAPPFLNSLEIASHALARTLAAPTWLRSGPPCCIGSLVLLGVALAAWKTSEIKKSAAAAANQPEPMETATAAVATSRDYRPTITSVGTVLAMRSITLSNEIAGTVRRVELDAGPDRRARRTARGARRVGRGGGARGAEGGGGAGADHARPHGVPEPAARPCPRRKWTRRAHRATWPRRRWRGPGRSSPGRPSARRSAPAIGISDVHPGQYLKEGLSSPRSRAWPTRPTSTSPCPSGSPPDSRGRQARGHRRERSASRFPPGSSRSTRGSIRRLGTP